MGKILYSAVTILSRLVSGLFIFYFLALYLKVDDFGRVTYFFTVAVIIGLLIDYGYNLKLSRDAVSKKGNLPELVGTALCVKCINALVSLLFLVFLSIYFSLDNSEILLLFLFVFSQFIQSVGFTLYPLLRADGQFKRESKLAIINNLTVFFVFIAAVQFETLGLYAMAIGFICGRTLVLIAFFRSEYFKQTTFNIKLLKKEYTVCFSFFCHAAVGYLYFNLDTVMIRDFVSFEEVGRYQAAMKFVLAATFMGEAITNVYVPKMIGEGFKDNRVILSFHLKVIKQMIGLGLLAGAGFYVLALYGTEMILGTEYVVSWLVVLPLALVVFLRYVGVYFGMLLTIVNKQMTRVIAGISALAALIIGIQFFGTDYGIAGAAFASLIAHITIMLIYIYSGVKELRRTDALQIN